MAAATTTATRAATTAATAAEIALAVLALAACKPARPAAAVDDPAPRPATAAAAAAAATAATAAAAAATATATPPPAPAEAAPPRPPPPPSCVDDGAPYGEAELRARVAQLAAPDLDGRAAGTAGDRAARAQIAERFRCLGLTPGGSGAGTGSGDGRGSYEQPFDDTANVIGYVAGADPAVGSQIILVGAHHDHLGGGMLGANDNASGVAALLAIAQAVRKAGPPRRTIAFVTFGAEERGLVGSEHLAAHPPAALPLDRIVEVVNLDMVGSHASAGAVYAFGAFPRLPARAILAELAARYPRLRVGLGGHSVRGDHLGFCERGVPYVFFWTPDHRCYHEACDTADRLDYPRMADIAALAGGLVGRLAATEVDLAAARARAGCGAR